MVALTWGGSASSAFCSRWLWVVVALLATILIFRSTATPEIISKYTPSRPLFGTNDDLLQTCHELLKTSNDLLRTSQNLSRTSDDASQTVDSFLETGDSLDKIRNSTLGFQRVFAISLPSRTDQRDALTLAGTLLDINIEMADGIKGANLNPKAIPLSEDLREKPFEEGAMGAWRAHVNVLQKIVRENIQSALIMEGDADWDIRLKDQLIQFAKAARILVQPGVGSDHSIDPTSPEAKSNDRATEFSLSDYDRVQLSMNSPYGDLNNWDVFWLGHCATQFTQPHDHLALGRVVISNDTTVPQPRWYDPILGSKDLKTSYPNNTRLVHHTAGNICTFAYAVTQKAARAMLYETGVHFVDSAMDIMLNNICGGRGRSKLRCLSVQPSYFYQHMRPGIISDINDHSIGSDSEPFTANIRLSTRMNLQQMIFGWENYTEQWRDEDPGEIELD